MIQKAEPERPIALPKPAFDAKLATRHLMPAVYYGAAALHHGRDSFSTSSSSHKDKGQIMGAIDED